MQDKGSYLIYSIPCLVIKKNNAVIHLITKPKRVMFLYI